jgi:hypothetical protein
MFCDLSDVQWGDHKDTADINNPQNLSELQTSISGVIADITSITVSSNMLPRAQLCT